MNHETNTAKVIARLEREGWEDVGGTKHAKFRKPGLRPIIVPRHRVLTPVLQRQSQKPPDGRNRDVK